MRYQTMENGSDIVRLIEIVCLVWGQKKDRVLHIHKLPYFHSLSFSLCLYFGWNSSTSFSFYAYIVRSFVCVCIEEVAAAPFETY